MYTELVPETVHYFKFHLNIYLQSFVSIYHLYHLFGIIIFLQQENHIQQLVHQSNHQYLG